MKISLNTLQKYQKQYGWSGPVAPDGADSLIERIGEQLAGIEQIIPIGAKYHDIIVARIVSCVPHDNSDHLNVCMVDDGGVAGGVARDEHGLVQVVCGAPNARAGLTVAWLPPGATVPSSYDSDPFVLTVREIRGKVSHGMLASPQELSIGDSHDGILEITDEITPGTMFAEAYNLRDDVIIDMENKMFTHRPDCFGFIGVAREIAGIQGDAFVSPDWYSADASVVEPTNSTLPLEIQVDVPDLVPRFSAVAINGITIGPSPVWLQVELAKLGLRPINNIVDLTNYHMLMTGQPLHAYDYDKVQAHSGLAVPTIIVRTAKADESLELLNGKTITPRDDAILITTPTGPIGLAGVMGGASTEVDESTTRIILESASFDMYSIRRTSMAHGLFSDAVTRFSKGQSPLQTVTVLAHATEDIIQIARGGVASQVVDLQHVSPDLIERSSLYPPVRLSASFINDRLGSDLAVDAIATLLRNVEFTVKIDNSELEITAPFWRTDIEIPEDVVEEVGRLYGYGRLPQMLPTRDITPAHKDPMFELKRRIRDTLSRAGANEVLTYSFVHGKLLDIVGQDKTLAYKLSNAISPELQYYRLSLTPSLLDKVHSNTKAGFDQFALFEIGKSHVLGHPDDQTQSDQNEPAEYNRLAVIIAGGPKSPIVGTGAAYYTAKLYLDTLLGSLGLDHLAQYEAYDPERYIGSTMQKTPYYEAGRTATVTVPYSSGRACLGEVGEYRSSTRRALKLPDYTVGFEIDLGLLLELVAQNSTTHPYTPQSRYPSSWQDVCLKVAESVTYDELYQLVNSQLQKTKPSGCIVTVKPLDIYVRPDDTAHKQITFRITLTSYDKTLTDDEVGSMLENVATAAHESYAAERI